MFANINTGVFETQLQVHARHLRAGAGAALSVLHPDEAIGGQERQRAVGEGDYRAAPAVDNVYGGGEKTSGGLLTENYLCFNSTMVELT